MPQKNAQDRLWKILTPVLLVLAVLAMAKTLFVGLEIDEEYAFSLGFRLVKGDRLFYTMWEPHQLSALPAALVLALYTAIAGTTTGALLCVRAVVLVCKAAMSAVFYRDFKQTIGVRKKISCLQDIHTDLQLQKAFQNVLVELWMFWNILLLTVLL